MFGEKAEREVSNRRKHYRKTRDDFPSTVFKNKAEKAEAEEGLREARDLWEEVKPQDHAARIQLHQLLIRKHLLAWEFAEDEQATPVNADFWETEEGVDAFKSGVHWVEVPTDRRGSGPSFEERLVIVSKKELEKALVAVVVQSEPEPAPETNDLDPTPKNKIKRSRASSSPDERAATPQRRSGRRSRAKDAASRALDDLYPDGLPGDPWKTITGEVNNWLTEKGERSVSEDSVRRAAKPK